MTHEKGWQDRTEIKRCPDCGRRVDNKGEVCESCLDSVESTRSNDRQNIDDPATVYYTNG